MNVTDVKTEGATDKFGNKYTNKISNDKLTNQDFLKLLLQEMKLQDPTKPMDSQRMMDSQMQMSTIETNLELAKSMTSLKTSFAQSALSTAANVIGKNIEDGNLGQNGVNKAYTVRSVENKNGEVFVRAQQMLFLEDNVKDKDGKAVSYNLEGNILDSTGAKTEFSIKLTGPGQVAKDSSGNPIIVDKDNKIVAQTDTFSFKLAGGVTPVYSDQLVSIPFNTVTKIF